LINDKTNHILNKKQPIQVAFLFIGLLPTEREKSISLNKHSFSNGDNTLLN
jgi:hypothetical protein